MMVFLLAQSQTNNLCNFQLMEVYHEALGYTVASIYFDASVHYDVSLHFEILMRLNFNLS